MVEVVARILIERLVKLGEWEEQSAVAEDCMRAVVDYGPFKYT
jgi:hypothetical protein